MNVKIPLKRFAETFGKNQSMIPAQAETFIKFVFDNISEELKAGGSVDIKGVGTFKLSPADEDPVMFIPARSFADDVNAPFAIFTPVELADGVSEDDLNGIEVTLPVTATPPEAVEQTAEAPEAVIEAIEVSHTEPAELPQAAVAQPVELTPAEEEAQAPEPVPGMEPVEQEPENEPEPEPVETQEPEPLPESEPATEPVSRIKEWEYEEEEYVTPAQTESGSRFGAGFVAGLIVGLAVGALALCMYVLYYVNSNPDEAQPVETELIEDTPIPTYQ